MCYFILFQYVDLILSQFILLKNYLKGQHLIYVLCYLP